MESRDSNENMVEEYMIGNTRIKIFDSSYVNRTQKDIEKILKNLTDIAMGSSRSMSDYNG